MFPTLLLAIGLNFGSNTSEPQAPSGVTVSFSDGTSQRDMPTRLFAARVEAGEAPAIGIAPTGWTGVFSGTLNLPIRTRAELGLRGTGSAVLSIDGEAVLDGGLESTLQTKQLRLNKGSRSINLKWTPPSEGPAWIRLLWDGRDFSLEPIPTQQLSTDTVHDNIEHGLELIAEHRCTACHASKASTFVSDLDRPAGSLRDAGQRLHGRWVQEWLLNPSAHRADTPMPALLSGPNAEQDAADLAAWVVSMGSGSMKAIEGRAQDGKVLAAKLQCLNCHVLEPEDDYEGISLAGVSQKYQPGALADFLRAPHARSPWSKMPDFRLSEQEAADLEAFLREAVPGQGAGVTGNVVRGEALAATLRCGNCHQSDAPPVPSLPLPTTPQTEMTGCLANVGNSSPDFRLSPSEQSAINQTFEALASTSAPTNFGFAARAVNSLRCTSCHARDGQASLGEGRALDVDPALLADPHAPEVDQTLPHLDGTGEKLRTAHLLKTLAGNRTQEVRPWMHARMPGFGAWAEPLTTSLVAEHGMPREEAFAATEEADATVGRMLVGLEGYGCITCHGVGDEPPMAAFEAVGVNFALSAERLRPGWYHRWMDDPLRITPSTRMPRYADPVTGKAVRPDILDGNATAQFDAIAAWLANGAQPGFADEYDFDEDEYDEYDDE